MQTKGVSINDDAGLEREADVMGQKALSTKLLPSNGNPLAVNPATINSNSTLLAQRQQAVIQRVTDQERYDNTIASAGTTTAAWEADYTAGTFLGRNVANGLHEELANRLSLAETSLQGDFPLLTLAEIRQEIGLDTISGRRGITNAVGGTRLSYHSYGLAIDVNYEANPFIGRSTGTDDVINRIVLFMTGQEFHIRAAQAGTTEEIRARYEAALSTVCTLFWNARRS